MTEKLPSVCLPTGVDENRTIDRAAWTSMVTTVRLPTGELDENRTIDLVATVLIPMVRPRLEKQYSRQWLEIALQEGLREGRLDLTRHAIRAAELGEEISDKALRHIAVEISRGELPDRQPGHLYVKTYAERKLLELEPHKGRPGRSWHDNWLRDIQFCTLIHFVHREFGICPTRNRAERRGDRNGNRAPSAISIVVAALARNGIHIDEKTMQEKIWLGPPGKLVRAILPG
jgi:hypothetical protein